MTGPKAQLILSADEQAQLTSIAAALSERARFVLACAVADCSSAVAQRFHVRNGTVGKWHTRFVKHRGSRGGHAGTSTSFPPTAPGSIRWSGFSPTSLTKPFAVDHSPASGISLPRSITSLPTTTKPAGLSYEPRPRARSSRALNDSACGLLSQSTSFSVQRFMFSGLML
jgi:hypothetical protein